MKADQVINTPFLFSFSFELITYQVLQVLSVLCSNEVSIYWLLIKLKTFSIRGKKYLLVFFLLVFPVPLSHQLLNV